MHARYIEHTFVESRKMARLHAMARNAAVDFSGAMLLATCQRVEIFSPDPVPAAVMRQVFGYDGRVASGTFDVYHRMLEIACGLRSQILGERFIARQFDEAIESLPIGSPLRTLAARAAASAERLRQQCDFYATLEYDEIALRYLSGFHCEDSASRKAIVIVGSGMLGHATCVRAARHGYTHIVLVTRNPKRSRKKFADMMVHGIHKAACVPADFLAQPFVAVIASDVCGAYADEVIRLLQAPQCRAIADMSAQPLELPEQLRGHSIHMYQESYLAQVEVSNRKLRPLVPYVVSQIAVSRPPETTHMPSETRRMPGTIHLPRASRTNEPRQS